MGFIGVIVAGFVSDVNTLLHFDEAWKDVLKEEGVGCFHMKDFVHSEGKFSSWKQDQRRRDYFIRRLITALRVAARYSISAAIRMSDYTECDRNYMLHESHHPCPLCARVTIGKTLRWANGIPVDEVELVFGQGPEHAGELLETMKVLGGPIPTFKDRCKFPGLQAADLIAWEHLKAYNNNILWGKDVRPFRSSLKQLSKIPNGWNNYSSSLLEEMYAQMQIKKRTIP